MRSVLEDAHAGRLGAPLYHFPAQPAERAAVAQHVEGGHPHLAVACQQQAAGGSAGQQAAVLPQVGQRARLEPERRFQQAGRLRTGDCEGAGGAGDVVQGGEAGRQVLAQMGEQRGVSSGGQVHPEALGALVGASPGPRAGR